MNIKIPDVRVLRAGVILLAVWTAWSLFVTFVNHAGAGDYTWSYVHQACTSPVWDGPIPGAGPRGGATLCSRINGLYNISTAVFWAGLLLLAWYFGARALAAFLARPGGQGGGETPGPGGSS
jgi:hypothetical protein